MLELGISSWFGYDLPIKTRLTMIKEAGFSTTCLWMGDEEDMVREGKADLIPAQIREQGLTLDNVHAPYRYCNLLWSASPEERDVIRREYKDVLLFCARHEIPRVVMHITLGYNPPPATEAGYAVIHELAGFAEENGVIMALENTLNTNHLEPAFSNIESPSLGFCYDCSHDFLNGQSHGGILKKWGHLLQTTHISDARGDRDDHLQLKEGTIDWEIFVKAFPRKSYRGALLLEIEKHAPGVLPEAFLKTAFQELQAIAARLG